MKKFAIILILLLIISAVAMVPENRKRPLRLHVPEDWPQPQDIFRDNPLTDAGFLLGKKLFYDGRLSRDGKFPCASCHEPRAAFATLDHDFSHGFDNQFTTRNAPALQNLAWQTSFNWDGKFRSLAAQAMSPITAPNEMAADIDSVLHRLRSDKEYRRMFKKAFGSREVTQKRMLDALAQFTGSMVSANSKYDRVKKGEDTFNSAEANGYTVFQAHCSSCHTEPLFTDNTFRNNGLPLDPDYLDLGRMAVTSDSKDSLKFKVPSLRNAGVTQPYMHDGRFYSLPEVVEHYTSGIHDGPTLDALLRKPINLSPREKHDLVYFLNTLTDSSFITNPAYQLKKMFVNPSDAHH